CSLGTRCNTKEEKQITPSSEFFRGEHGEWATEFAITTPNARHQKLIKLVGAAFLQCSREVARQNAELQHVEATPQPVASLAEHLAEFDSLWAGLHQQWLRKLSSREREKFDGLATDTDRNAFRIVRNWSQSESPDFKVHCKSLANRLGVTLKTASNIR